MSRLLVKYSLPLLLALTTLIAYSPAFNGDFIWDDNRYISENPHMTDVAGLANLWMPRTTDQYYPLAYTTFWVEKQIWGNRPLGFHLINVLLHIINALLLVGLMHQLKLPGAWLLGFLFALHPVHVESVAWMTERKNVLSGMFFLIALHAYWRFRENHRTSTYWLSISFMLCALLSKTTACVMPIFLLALDWRKDRSWNWRSLVKHTPYWGLAALTAAITVWVEHEHVGATKLAFPFTLAERLLLAGQAWWFYLGKMLWPTALSFSYGRFSLDTQSALWLWPLGVLGLFALLWWKRRVFSEPLLALAVFTAALAPTLGLINFYTLRYSFAADHYQYLPSMALLPLLAWGMMRVTEKWLSKWKFILLIPIALLAWQTWRQAHIYKNSESIWRDVVAKNHGSDFGHSNLAGILLKKRNFQGAEIHYRQALTTADFWETHAGLAVALHNQERYIEAIAQFEQALKMNPQAANVRNNLGISYFALGRRDDAIREFRKAVQIEPDNKPARDNLRKLGVASEK